MNESAGSTPGRPVWIREVPCEPTRAEKLADALNVAARIVTVAYSLLVAWQTLKILNPPLQVKEDLFIAALKQRFTRPEAGALPELPAEARAALYDDLRG